MVQKEQALPAPIYGVDTGTLSAEANSIEGRKLEQIPCRLFRQVVRSGFFVLEFWRYPYELLRVRVHDLPMQGVLVRVTSVHNVHQLQQTVYHHVILPRRESSE